VHRIYAVCASDLCRALGTSLDRYRSAFTTVFTVAITKVSWTAKGTALFAYNVRVHWARTDDNRICCWE
jgi:hypothetical protein